MNPMMAAATAATAVTATPAITPALLLLLLLLLAAVEPGAGMAAWVGLRGRGWTLCLSLGLYVGYAAD